MILSKPPLMSRRRVEDFFPAFCVAMTSCLREMTASVVEMLGREPHWFELTRAREGEREYSLSATSFSRILETVCRREMILNDAGVV
jgi:hypothetical protein